MVAADLNKSRPSIYKYVDKFDNGDLEGIPPEVVTYFREKLSSDVEKASVIEKRLDIAKQLNRYKMELYDAQAKMESIIKRREKIMYTLSPTEEDARKGLDDRRIADMKAELDAINREFIPLSESIHLLERKIDDLQLRDAALGKTKFVPQTSQTFHIKSECFIENGRYMVIHTGEDTIEVSYTEKINTIEEPVYYRLHLYAKIGSEYAHLGLYKPVKYRNFFIIDDVFMSVPLYYNIVTCMVDENFDDWDRLAEGEDPPLVELSGKECTGLCELKPKK
jgi:hypothetical protein